MCIWRARLVGIATGGYHAPKELVVSPFEIIAAEHRTLKLRAFIDSPNVTNAEEHNPDLVHQSVSV